MPMTFAGMAGGFDAGEALRDGLIGRRQAWEFIGQLAAEWTAPLAPGDGVSRDTWRAAEQRIGAEPPAALREAYLLFGRRPDLTARQDRLVPPHELSVDESGTTVVFRVENQHCAAWGVALADLDRADPPVYVQDRDGGGWKPFLDRVSVACVGPGYVSTEPARNPATSPNTLVIAVLRGREKVTSSSTTAAFPGVSTEAVSCVFPADMGLAGSSWPTCSIVTQQDTDSLQGTATTANSAMH
jgi:hypothetical protein